MKTALITTTINVPTVLELYRQHGPDVAFFVAGDRKSPHDDIVQMLAKLDGQVFYFQPENQTDWKCSGFIGWNSIQRRNIALLEAVKWGADIIVSIDDDNIPLGRYNTSWDNYFNSFGQVLAPSLAERGDVTAFRGIKVSSPTGWFDVGQLLDPIAPHRGFPISVDGSKYEVSHVTNGKVGVAAGMCLGDPDISAVTRIASGPVVHRVSELLNAGIVVDPKTWTVFNSQNTAFIRELAPAFFMLPGVGRYDDIYASLIMQRVMRERNLHVHFGKPFVWQQRNAHNLVKDLAGEIDGMANIEQFARYLDRQVIDGRARSQEQGSILDHCRKLYASAPLPPQTIEAALAFLEDMEGVL